MTKAIDGNKVKINYTGTLDDGTEFDSSVGREPLEFVLGSGQVIPGFNDGVLGMEINEKKKIHIPIADAYGARREDMIISVPKAELPPDLDAQPGMQMQMQHQEGQVFNVIIAEIKEDTVTLDGNHPLADQNLNFELELVEIVAE